METDEDSESTFDERLESWVHALGRVQRSVLQRLADGPLSVRQIVDAGPRIHSAAVRKALHRLEERSLVVRVDTASRLLFALSGYDANGLASPDEVLEGLVA